MARNQAYLVVPLEEVLAPVEPPKRRGRENHKPFTVWVDEDLTRRLRTLSRDLITKHGRPGHSIEALVAEGIEHVLRKHADREKHS
jgi:hypothetical protein